MLIHSGFKLECMNMNQTEKTGPVRPTHLYRSTGFRFHLFHSHSHSNLSLSRHSRRRRSHSPFALQTGFAGSHSPVFFFLWVIEYILWSLLPFVIVDFGFFGLFHTVQLHLYLSLCSVW